MFEILFSMSKNVVLMSALIAWFSAQMLKVVFYSWKNQAFKTEWLVGSGGMPSSHTALVVGLAVSIGSNDGYNSTEFAVAFVLAAVVMYDAAGVRRAAGKQAKVINKLIQEMRVEHKVTEKRLKELVGHNPLEVLAGAMLGIVVAYWIRAMYG